MSTVAPIALTVASSPSFSSSRRTTANADKLNKRIKQQKDNNGKNLQFYRFYGSDLCSVLEGSTEEHNYTAHLPNRSVVTELVGSIQNPAKYS